MLLGEMGAAQLLNPALMASAAEGRGEEGLDTGLGHLDPDQPRAHRDDVGIVMLAGEAGGERLGDQSRAAGGMAVGRDRDADPRTAQSNAEFGAAGGHLLGEL